ncbi:helix-turn-helix domain-containing protein [Brevundimonas diminuta]|uniref:helix-turn-helix domain-containing protein n=1 Tax=Brevundimonas diminuta TaxID=293 RepID=UPI003D9AAF4C
MIKNQRQYKATVKQIAHFRANLEALPVPNPDDSPRDVRRKNSSRRAMESMLKTMERQVAEFEAISQGDMSRIMLNGLHDLPKALIQTRIARGMSQRDLADILGVKAQQVQRWEHEDYDRITFSRLEEVADALQIGRRLELKNNTPATPTGSSKLHFGELRCLSAPTALWTSWQSTRNPTFVHAKGEVTGAANEGTGTGQVSVLESSQGISVKVSGLGQRLDGTYSRTSSSKNVVQNAATWHDDRKEKLYA